MIIQNLWDTTKAALKGKLMAINSYLRRQEKSQINHLFLHLKQLDKEQTKPNVSIRKKSNIRATINERDEENNSKDK